MGASPQRPGTDNAGTRCVRPYSPAFLPPLRAWLDGGRRDLQRLLDRVDAVEIRDSELRVFGDPRDMLHNINTPEDLEAARARVSGAELP